VLVRHSEELETDLLMHFNGIDLKDFWTGKLSLRRLAILIHRLLKMHGRSAVSEAVLGEQASWSNIEYMLADIRDSIEAGNYFFLSAHRDEKKPMPEFKMYPRPGWDMDQSVTNQDEPDWASAQEIAELFNYMHGG
jgi:hypothetical protein